MRPAAPTATDDSCKRIRDYEKPPNQPAGCERENVQAFGSNDQGFFLEFFVSFVSFCSSSDKP
jgi:hypothetical protein